jgi:hypothetical protein
MHVLAIAGIAVAGAGSWLAAPLVDMARRGTIDDRTRRECREVGLRAEAVRRAHRREALVAAASASVPAPRPAADGLPRRSPVA